MKAVNIGRDEFIAELGAEGIGAGLHFTPVHLHKWYREKYGYKRGDLPVVEQAGEEIMSLPLYPLLTDADVRRVVDSIKKIVAKHRGTGTSGAAARHA